MDVKNARAVFNLVEPLALVIGSGLYSIHQKRAKRVNTPGRVMPPVLNLDISTKS